MAPTLPRLESELARSQAEYRERGLERRLEPAAGGADFCSNDYLGLARHPDVVRAAVRAAESIGVGARASRLLGGGSPFDRELERAVADWLGAEDALLFPSGYQANLGVVTSLAGRGDALVCDERVHASLVDAARLSRARVRVFAHNDPNALEAALREAALARRRLVLVESIYSMDGDRCPLGELAAVCARHDGWLLVDEAHAIGLLGGTRREGAGLWCEALEQGAQASVLAARVVTGGKALGVGGALVVGSARLRAELVGRARAFVFTTGVSPVVAGALLAAVRLAREARSERASALGHARRIAQALALPAPAAAIVPWIVGDSRATLELAQSLQRSGFDARAVRPPTVPEGTARLRLVAHAGNTRAEVEGLIDCLRSSAGATVSARSAAVGRAPRAVPLVVVGTDTGVGKTVVSALLVRAAARRGGAAYWKPVQTGSDCDTGTVRALIADLIDDPAVPPTVTLFEPGERFALPASPHEAAAAEGRTISVEALDARLEAHLRGLAQGTGGRPSHLIVELAGGLLVPLTESVTQADWLAERMPAVVLVARTALGTLNHSLLTIGELRARGLPLRALVLCGAPHPSNRDTLQRLAGAPVLELEQLSPLNAAALAARAERPEFQALLDA